MPEKNKSEELDDEVRGRFESWESDDFISEILKLRQESGGRRIKLKKYEEDFSGLQEDLTTSQTTSKVKIDTLSVALENLQKENKKLRGQISSDTTVSKEAAEEMRKEVVTERDALKVDMAALQNTLQKERILRIAYFEIYTNGYKFRNALERAGFEASVLTPEENGNFKSTETVQEEVQEFLTSNRQNVNIPIGGKLPVQNLQRNKVKRAQELVKKKRLTPEEINELKALTNPDS
jgi:hypothetical protein